MDNVNYQGVILPTIEPLSLEFGGMTTVEKKIVFPNGDARFFLPPFKSQAGVYMDTFGCVSHSFNKGVRTYLKAGFGFDYDFADRDLVVLSGTKHRVGNSGNKVLETARRIHLIPFRFEDFDLTSRDPKYTVERYYAYARVPEAQPEADKFNEKYDIVGEWVGRDKWEEASQYGALQLYVNAWYKDNNGEYYNPTGRFNHAVLMANYDTRQISDTYQPELKTLRSWDAAYPLALKINIIKKHMAKPNLKNNTLVILVEGAGGIGLYLDNKIIVDDTAKVLSVFMARNAKDGEFTGGAVRSLTQEDWDKFEKRKL